MSLNDYYCSHCDVTHPQVSRSFIKKHSKGCSMKPQRTQATIQSQPFLGSTRIVENLSYRLGRRGRQIAVNNTYLGYAFNPLYVVVVNISTAAQSFFRSVSQRVNDMAFFAGDVHLLASAGIDGRIMVWEVSDEKDGEVTGKTIIALLISGQDNIENPCVCWHLNNQEILIVGFGKRVLKIDTNKVGKVDTYTADSPFLCSVDDLCDGIKLVGVHEGEVTDLSMVMCMSKYCLVSASTDGTVKLWLDDQESASVVLQPYDGLPVFAATFFTAPNNPGHIILVTMGPNYREVKIWVNREDDGFSLPLAKSLRCTHILDLQSSAGALENVFSKRVVALSQAGLLLFANSRRSAITVVRIDYGPNPIATRMDNASEVAVHCPILSLGGICDAHGLSVAQIYCLHSQVILKYTLKASATASVKEKKGKTDTVQTGASTSLSKEMTQAIPKHTMKASATASGKEKKGETDTVQTGASTSLSKEMTQAIMKYNLQASATASVKEKKGETDTDKIGATTSRSEEIMQKQTSSSKSIDAKENEVEAKTNRPGLTLSLEEATLLKQMSSLQKQIKIMVGTYEARLAIKEMQLQECIEKISSMQANFNKLVAQSIQEAIDNASSLVMQLSGPVSKFPEKMDPLNELDSLILEDKFEEAFTRALGGRDAETVSWLCSRVGISAIMSLNPCPLSQSVLLSLLEQLGCDLERDTERKLLWMMDVARGITPTDPMIACRVRPIVGEIFRLLGPVTLSSKGNSSACQLQHVILSLYASCN